MPAKAEIPDRPFLESLFHKLLLNFTWWVNRKDLDGNNVFQGGFLGLDNISVFDRSAGLPEGGHIDQSDGTAWMGFYCLMMMKIALELGRAGLGIPRNFNKLLRLPGYGNQVLRALFAYRNCHERRSWRRGVSLWDEKDRFYYDLLHMHDGTLIPLKVRSMVGLIPLFAVETLEPRLMSSLPEFNRRTHWFIENRPRLASTISSIDAPGVGQRYLTSLLVT